MDLRSLLSRFSTGEQPDKGMYLSDFAKSFRPSENVEDRRRRGAGDFEQRHRIRTAIAEQEYQNGIDPRATYTREDLGRWLDRNNIDDGTYIQQTEPDWRNLPPSPLPGYQQNVEPIDDITAHLYRKYNPAR